MTSKFHSKFSKNGLECHGQREEYWYHRCDWVENVSVMNVSMEDLYTKPLEYITIYNINILYNDRKCPIFS